MQKNKGGIRTVAGLLLFSALFLASAVWMKGAMGEPLSILSEGEASIVVVLDAGHGGEDGGAVGVNGVLEKDLNLDITMMLGEMLTAAGVSVVYTRTEDRLLYTEAENIKGQRKIYDLYNRLAMARETENAVLVSIHMNKFSEAKYSGFEAYYSPHDKKSRSLAAAIRDRVKADLQPENRRPLKAAGDDIYLLHRAEFPAVLLECGFLSNPEECEKLSKEDYKRQLSFSLFCGIMEYIRTNGGERV